MTPQLFSAWIQQWLEGFARWLHWFIFVSDYGAAIRESLQVQ